MKYIIVVLLVVVGCTSASTVCQLDSCQGMYAQCAFLDRQVCSLSYQLGDFCREYISCSIVSGDCVTLHQQPYALCVSCVETCLETEDPFSCEQDCRLLMDRPQGGGVII